MTISYSNLVFTSKGIGTFLKLLLKWKGSIYKMVWRELLIYMVLYASLSLVYRLALDDEAQQLFENLCIYCGKFGEQIPITFVLGFYVTLVVNRWWDQFESIPWPDSASLWVSTCIQGHDERGRLMRRTIVRYLNLGFILCLRLTCLPVKKRFPTLEHLVEAGILEEKEKEIIAEMQKKSNQRSFWMPLIWAGSIVIRARKENRIKNDQTLEALITHIADFRNKLAKLLHYDWVPVPLVYTQVVTLAVYSFLFSTLPGSQFLNPEKKYSGHEVDFYIPVFTFLQFFFYMGWLKVAEALINPFGEDDDDFEINWLIDRNLCVSYLIVDDMHLDHPDLVKDQFWDEHYPELPYTIASEDTQFHNPIVGSTANIEVPLDKGYFVQDDLRMVVTDEEKDALLFTDEEDKMNMGSRSTINGSTGRARSSIPRNDSMLSRLQSAFSGSKSGLGSTFSIFGGGRQSASAKGRLHSQRRPSRMSHIRMSQSEDQDEMKNYQKPGIMFDYDDILSIDSGGQTANASLHNLNHKETFAEQSSPTVRRLWRRMSEPVNDVPQHEKKSNIPRVHTHPKNFILQKVEILQSFTEEAINVLRQDLEATKAEATKTEARQENSNISDLLKALDETHQQFRNKLLRNVYQNKRQSSANKEETEIFVSDAVSEAAAESPHRTDDVKKFLFKLDDLSGSLASLDRTDDHSGSQIKKAEPSGTQVKPPSRAEPTGSQFKPILKAEPSASQVKPGLRIEPSGSQAKPALRVELPGSQIKPASRAEPPGSPLPDMLHPHELAIIEEQNEADNVSENEETQETDTKEIDTKETSPEDTSTKETEDHKTELPKN